MAGSSFLDRFSLLEIPQEKRRIDWGFLRTSLSLPDPLPLADHPLLALINGRALAPSPVVSSATPAAGRSIFFYADTHGLEEVVAPAAAEGDYLARHRAQLERETKRFLDAVPTDVLREPELVRAALQVLELGSPQQDGAGGATGGGAELPSATLPDADSALPALAAGHLAPSTERALLNTQLLGYARILRIHAKLYNLLTLREYVAIFEKAIEPTCFRSLQALPITCGPDEMLQRIERSLSQIHAKARSPLRNKMECTRLLFNGVTLLPVYREATTALFDSYRRLIERRLKMDVLARYVRA